MRLPGTFPAVREPPDLADGRLTAAVRRHYGLPVTTLTFLPLGLDVRAWAYRVTAADGAVYFLKLRQGLPNPAALRVPRYLADRGVPHVVAPLPTRAGRLWAALEEFTLTLYPFIEGTTGGAHGLQEHHWVTYGAALRAIHDTPLTPRVRRVVPRESFTSHWPDLIRALDARIAGATFLHPIEREWAAFWQARRADIWALVERLETLGRRLRAARPPLVLCHGDAHHNNVLIDRDERFWIVDWDDTLCAPKECDLMMGVGGLSGALVGLRETAWFLRGYGPARIDLLALAYYRHLRAVGDLATNGEQAWLAPGVGEAVKATALQRARQLFAPGYIVSLATAAADHVS